MILAVISGVLEAPCLGFRLPSQASMTLLSAMSALRKVDAAIILGGSLSVLALSS